MPSELRQRITHQNPAANRTADPMSKRSYDESHLSARALLAASPIHAAPAMKMHIPAMYGFLPAKIQWILSRCCPRSWSPQWKRRYLIALGGYLYRFKDEHGPSPKGAPISAATTDARIITQDDVDSGEFNVVLDHLPEGCNAVFEISSIGKTQYFAVESREEAMAWVNSLRQMQQDGISRNMGHSKDIPYPSEWKSFDASAKRLMDQKARIKTKLQAMDKKEQEMQTLGGGPGMGYYS